MTPEKTIRKWLKRAGRVPLLQAKQSDAGLNMRLVCCGELICVHQHYVALAIKRAIDAQPPAIYNHPPMPVDWPGAADWGLGWVRA